MTSFPADAAAPRSLRVTARDGLVAVAMLLAGGVLLAAGPGEGVTDNAAQGPASTDGGGGGGPVGGRAGPPASEEATTHVHVPTGDHDAGGAQDGDVELATRVAVLPAYHRVEAGETLTMIAERYAVDRGKLARRNAIENPRALAVGDRLLLPDADTEPPADLGEARTADLQVERVLEEVAHELGWRPAIVKAVAWAESRWTHAIVSPEGAVGVMQVRPPTGAKMADRVGRDLDLYELRDNVTAGVAYLDYLHDRFDGDVRAMLAAYVQGPTSLRDYGPYPVSERYVDEVLDLRERFED